MWDNVKLVLFDDSIIVIFCGFELIKNMLSFVCKVFLEFCFIDFNDVVGSMWDLIFRVFLLFIQVEMYFVVDLWLIKVDFSMIESVLLNLIINVCDVSLEGGKISIGI